MYYKRYQMIYPDGYFELEQIGIFIVLGVQYLRIYCGSKGNKCETSWVVFLFLSLLAPSFIGNIYYVTLQTFA